MARYSHRPFSASGVRNVEMLEDRRLMAVINDVQVSLTGGVLNITGDQFGNTVDVSIKTVASGTSTANTVSGGQTNIRLNTTVLSSVGLNVTGSSSTLTPASGFTVSYPITGGGFKYNPSPFAAQAGSIDHTGSVTFNNGELIVSGLRIAFDTNRVTSTNSGFYVIGTVEVNKNQPEPTAVLRPGEVVLFDVGRPASLTASANTFRAGEANLLVAPELVAALDAADVNTTAPAGADIGDVLIDGNSTPTVTQRIVVRTRNGTFINGNTASTVRSFAASGVRGILAQLGGGADALSIRGLSLSRDVTIRTGPANDSVLIRDSRLRTLAVNLSAGDDSLSLNNVVTRGDQRFQGGAGTDRFTSRLFSIRSSLFDGFGKVDIRE